jgi:hypothetical protein
MRQHEMNRTMAFAVTVIIGVAGPAAAQSSSNDKPDFPHFVQGSFFADLHRWDWPVAPHPVGGSAAVGGFLSARTSFDLEIEVPQFGEYSSTFVGPGGPQGAAPLVGALQVQRIRTVTITTLVGFHAASWGDLELDYLVGFAVLHYQGRYRNETWLVSEPENVRVHTVTDTANQPAAAVGIDARRMLGRRFAVVPQIRVYLSHGSAIARPSIGARLYF